MKKYLFTISTLLIGSLFFSGCSLWDKNNGDIVESEQLPEGDFCLVTENDCHYKLIINDLEEDHYPKELSRFNSKEEAIEYIKEQGGEDRMEIEELGTEGAEKFYLVRKKDCRYDIIIDHKENRAKYGEGVEFDSPKEALDYGYKMEGGMELLINKSTK